METIKVMLVDDHDVVRRGLRAYLSTEEGIEVVGEASCGLQAIELASSKPDVVLMDLLMDGMDGIETTRRIKDISPDSKVVVLTSFVEDDKVLPAMEAGATSYILKTSSAEDIVKAIRAAAVNQRVIDSQAAEKMLSGLQQAKAQSELPHHDLTERELDVLKLMAEGLSNKEIGEQLYIGIKTVKTHVSNILLKLQVADRTQAAIYAHRHSLVSNEENR